MIDEEINAGVPILRLPADITTEIFNLVIGLDIDTLSDDIEDNILPLTPLHLGAVCRSWRTFVWETPSFWAVIVLTLRDERCNNQIDILELWLRNSGTYPLEIWFDPRLSGPSNYDDFFCDPPYFDYGPSIVALRKLVDQSGKWKRFGTHIIHDQEFIDVLRQVKGRIPLLQSGRLNLHFNTTKLDMFENAPLLKEFTMSKTSKLPGDYVLLPWRQLTSFYGRDVDEEDCVAVLSLCTNLIVCVFSNVGSRTDDFENGKIISLPRLRSLSMSSARRGGGIETILRHIRCPKLHRLHLSEGAWSLPYYAQLEDFINQSNCDLKVLHLEDLSKLSSVLPLLESLPSLQSLIVQYRLVTCFHVQRGSQTEIWSDMGVFEVETCDHDDTDSFFDSLLTKLDLTLTTTTTSMFLPNLSELQTWLPLPHPSYRHRLVPTSLNFLKVLRQRWNPPEGVAKLQKVFVEDTLTLDESDDGSVIDGLKDLKRKGMKIMVPGL